MYVYVLCKKKMFSIDLPVVFNILSTDIGFVVTNVTGFYLCEYDTTLSLSKPGH